MTEEDENAVGAGLAVRLRTLEATVAQGGLQGPQGEQGIQGPAGADGQDGAPGTQGIQGVPGVDGTDGTNGVGVPVGGTTGQVLSKIDTADYNTQWITPQGGSPAWGTITGTISAQTDLQSALDTKSATTHNHDAAYEAKNINIQAHVTAAHAPSNAQKNSDITKAEIEAVLTGQISSHSHAGGGGEAFPINSVFLSVVNTNPNTLLGYGTWSQIAGGQVLVGQTSGDADFNVGEETGGEKTHTLTVAEMPSHTHTLQRYPTTTGSSSGFTADTSMSGTPTDVTLATASAGSGAAHNNMPPYFVVYIWKRTA